MEKKSEQLFDKIKKDVTAYIEFKFEYLKLSTYERTGKVLGVLSYGLILLFTAFFAGNILSAFSSKYSLVILYLVACPFLP